MLKKIQRVIQTPKLLPIYLLSSKFSKILPEKFVIRLKYKLIMNQTLDIENPKSFNKKLQWLKLNDKNKGYSQLVDKYEVREYISQAIGQEYLIPLLGVYSSYEDICFEELPNEFVLKPNHTSGDVFICTNKQKIDHKKLKNCIKKWLRKDYYWVHREFPYKGIKPKIICEQLLKEESSEDIKDYKFLCFDGEVKCSFVCSNRNASTGLNVDFYDREWNKMPFERHYPRSDMHIPKPNHYEKMIELSERLSKDFAFVRVDFYESNGRLYFGELTFYPGSGYESFNPYSYDLLLGGWIDLSKVNN